MRRARPLFAIFVLATAGLCLAAADENPSVAARPAQEPARPQDPRDAYNQALDLMEADDLALAASLFECLCLLPAHLAHVPAHVQPKERASFEAMRDVQTSAGSVICVSVSITR